MDGFQSWSPKNNGADSTISNVVIEENQFWEWKGPEAPTLPCRLQGIGLFDGFYKDFRIRNNLVVVSHYHGISIYGAINSVIANNTVVRPQGQPGKSPWISVQTHKRGDPSKNTRVFNNVAMSYKDIANALRANAVVRYPAQAFVAPAQGDFTPLPDGPLVDRAVGPSPAPFWPLYQTHPACGLDAEPGVSVLFAGGADAVAALAGQYAVLGQRHRHQPVSDPGVCAAANPSHSGGLELSGDGRICLWPVGGAALFLLPAPASLAQSADDCGRLCVPGANRPADERAGRHTLADRRAACGAACLGRAGAGKSRPGRQK
ncbi:hypothetical protein GQR58_029279 [Nymphon striatum]|nr:hypothetical protein GQR58_029279 [Nymphon striatum]